MAEKQHKAEAKVYAPYDGAVLFEPRRSSAMRIELTIICAVLTVVAAPLLVMIIVPVFLLMVVSGCAHVVQFLISTAVEKLRGWRRGQGH